MNVDSLLNPSLPTSKPSSSEIIHRPLDGLRPDPANPRCHSKKQVRQIAESIKAFGFNVPILIDREGSVVAGDGRLAAGRELGMTQVPTLCLDHLTPAQLRAFRIADNRLRDRDLGRPAARRTAQGPLAARARFQPRSHRF
jgi:ParB-like chromosome segregation protein Spo0J